jgi:hypothetical protein
MSARKYSNAEEFEEKWSRVNLTLIPSYKQPPLRNTPAEISRVQNARVISRKEEKEKNKRWPREHFDTVRAANTHDSMSQDEMEMKRESKNEKGKAREKVKWILQQYKQVIPVKNILQYVNKTVEEFLHPSPKLVIEGESPPHSKGGYNYRKYKYTNITKKPVKPKIMAKKPAKQKTMAKKPEKRKILTKKPAKQKTMAKKPTKPKIMAKKPAKPKI